MGIAVNKDGEIVLTLDDDYNLSTDALRTLGLGSYGANKNTPGGRLKNSEMAPFIFPEGTNNDLKMYLDNLAEKTNITPDVPEPKSDAELKEIELKKLERLTDPKSPLDVFKERTIDPIQEFITEDLMDMIKNPDGMDLLNRLLPDDLREDILKEKNKTMIDGVPGSTDNKDSKSDIKIQEIIEQLIPPTKKKSLKDLEKDLEDFNKKNRGTGKDTDADTNTDTNTDTDTSTNKKTKKEEPKDERTKIGKIMDGLLSKDDFLMDLGLRLMEGEGVFPGAIKAAKTQKAADAKEAKAKLDAALADSLIKDRLAPADVLQIAQVEAANVNPDSTSQEYKDAFRNSVIRQTSKSKNDISPTELMLLTMMSGGDTQEAAQGYLNNFNTPDVVGDAVENFKAYDVGAVSKS